MTLAPQRRSTIVVTAALALSLVGTAVGATAADAAAKTKRASVKSNGNQSNGEVHFIPEISGNGRFVVFRSDATDLVGNDTKGFDDLFVRDFKKGKTRRVSVGTGGVEANAVSTQPSISDDGRFVTFRSNATNIGGNPSGLVADIFLRDRKTGKTRLISQSNKKVKSNSDSFEPKISGDGRFVTYYTIATTIVPNDANGSRNDIMVYDRVKRKTTRVSKSSKGVQGELNSNLPDISATGRYVVFSSVAENLVGSDGNNIEDVFLHDRKTKKTKLISKHSNGAQGDGRSGRPTVSANGRFVAFESQAKNLTNANDDNGITDVFLHDRKTKKTKWISTTSKGSGGHSPSISNDGRYIGFQSSSGLIGKDDNNTGDLYVYDRVKKKLRRVSLKSNGGEIPWGGGKGKISANGKFVSFVTGYALGSKDTNDKDDAFRRGPLR